MSRDVLARGPERTTAALASAALFGLAFPPFPAVAAAIVCLVPITILVFRLADARASWRDAARAGLWFGAVGYGLNLTWIIVALSAHPGASVLGYVATIAMLGAAVGIAMAVLWRLRASTGWPAVLLLPMAWIALEVTLTVLPELAFPWLPLALSATGAPILAQLADVSGPHGLSFVLAAVNGALVDAWLARGSRARVLGHVAAGAVLLVLAALYGTWRLRGMPLRDVAPVAVVQPSVARDEKWAPEHRARIVAHIAQLTRQAATLGKPALIVWPEAALPAALERDSGLRDTLDALVKAIDTPVLLGVIEPAPREADARWFNAAVLAAPRAPVQPSYHKAHLVPVIERLPLARAGTTVGLPFAGDYARGGAAIPFELSFGRAGALICFESAFASRAREQRRARADLLIALTNDAWFGGTFGTRQHLAHLVLRAIESRAGVVRAANTGISAYIDPRGIVHDATAEFAVVTPLYATQTTSIVTPYVRFGNWVGITAAFCTVALLLIPAARRRRA